MKGCTTMLIKNNYKVLFHGDSITDAGRDRNDLHSLSPNGYTSFAAERFNKENPDMNVEFFNRAISGYRTCDTLTVLKRDLDEVKPDLVSLHIGINDVWRHYDSNSYTSGEQFEANLTEICKTIKATGAKLVILGLYHLPAPDKLGWADEVAEKVAITAKIAKEYADAYVNTDEVFKTVLGFGAPWERFSPDGVHPNVRGAEILSDCFIKAVK